MAHPLNRGGKAERQWGENNARGCLAGLVFSAMIVVAAIIAGVLIVRSLGDETPPPAPPAVTTPPPTAG